MEHLSPIIKSKEPVPTDKETGQWLDSASEEELSRLRQIIRTTGVPNAPFSVEHDPLFQELLEHEAISSEDTIIDPPERDLNEEEKRHLRWLGKRIRLLKKIQKDVFDGIGRYEREVTDGSIHAAMNKQKIAELQGLAVELSNDLQQLKREYKELYATRITHRERVREIVDIRKTKILEKINAIESQMIGSGEGIESTRQENLSPADAIARMREQYAKKRMERENGDKAVS
jgi:Txe/YoeB family toxin of Txe-Axe toxin-antitoxin module